VGNPGTKLCNLYENPEKIYLVGEGKNGRNGDQVEIKKTPIKAGCDLGGKRGSFGNLLEARIRTAHKKNPGRGKPEKNRLIVKLLLPKEPPPRKKRKHAKNREGTTLHGSQGFAN